jgi:AMMECR1 domain-containing protein
MRVTQAALALLVVGALHGRPTRELTPYVQATRVSEACTEWLDAARAGLAQALGDSAAVAAAPIEAAAPDWPGTPRPLYVTLAHGSITRACVGSDTPLAGTLAESLRALGEQLATQDLRHPPLRAEELDSLRLVVAFAGDPQPVAEPQSIDPMHEGLKIESDRGSVAFLPGEARTVAWAQREARRIGVISGRDSEARYSRFNVVVIQGPARRAGTAPR